MVVEEPLLRLGVIVAMAAGGVIFLLLLSLFMYACCRSHRGRTLPPGPSPPLNGSALSTIYSPDVIFQHDDSYTDVNRLQIQPPVRAVSTREATTSRQPTVERDLTPPPPYEDVVCLHTEGKSGQHDYCT